MSVTGHAMSTFFTHGRQASSVPMICADLPRPGTSASTAPCWFSTRSPLIDCVRKMMPSRWCGCSRRASALGTSTPRASCVVGAPDAGCARLALPTAEMRVTAGSCSCRLATTVRPSAALSSSSSVRSSTVCVGARGSRRVGADAISSGAGSLPSSSSSSKRTARPHPPSSAQAVAAQPGSSADRPCSSRWPCGGAQPIGSGSKLSSSSSPPRRGAAAGSSGSRLRSSSSVIGASRESRARIGSTPRRSAAACGIGTSPVAPAGAAARTKGRWHGCLLGCHADCSSCCSCCCGGSERTLAGR